MKGILGDLLVVISSSGNSPNIIKVLEAAKEKKIQTLAMVGFDGGRASKLADIVLHVQEDNYGIVEDAHQMLMHVLAQFIRVTNLNKNIDDIKL
jgi:D-sedoheptulose 7-phosphate isomerase/D-glycero-D-manno-heptose 1,7-bisphosphate phosphatase